VVSAQRFRGFPPGLTAAEKVHVVARLRNWGHSARAIAERVRMSERQVERLVGQARDANLLRATATMGVPHTERTSDMDSYVAQVGVENAAWLAENVGPSSGNPPVFADLGFGVVEILDLAAAMALSPEHDGVVSEDAGDLVVSVEGTGYVVTSLRTVDRPTQIRTDLADIAREVTEERKRRETAEDS